MNLASAAESGWDFSSRWFSDKTKMSTIHTTDVVPVDLNVILQRNEHMLAQFYDMLGEFALLHFSSFFFFAFTIF